MAHSISTGISRCLVTAQLLVGGERSLAARVLALAVGLLEQFANKYLHRLEEVKRAAHRHGTNTIFTIISKEQQMAHEQLSMDSILGDEPKKPDEPVSKWAGALK